MLRDVTTTISDGGLLSAPTGTGIHCKIGVSPIVANEPVKITGSMNAKKIQEKLGLSPLADACMDSIQNGAATIYCIPVSASVDGTVSEVIKTGTGTGTVVVSGKPNNAYKIIFEVVNAGELNVATVRYSINGGVTYSEELTLPLGGVVPVSPTGLTFTFTAGTGFVAGDKYSLTTTAPTMSNQDVLTAIAKLRSFTQTIEFVHIVGSSAKALWSAVAVEAAALFTQYHKPIFFVMEAAAPTSGQTVETYVSSLITDRKGCDSIYLQVVSASGTYKRLDGTVQDINLAGVICGLYARATVQQSIGETKSFSIPDNLLLSLSPLGIEDHIADLDEAGYLTLRRYEGLTGYYVTNARMFAPEGSDYQYAERVRVSNKMVREVRKEMLLQLQSSIDISNLDAELNSIAKFAETPLEKMVDRKEASSARVIIPEGQDILGTDKLAIIIRYVPIGYLRAIDIDLGMENPFARK